MTEDEITSFLDDVAAEMVTRAPENIQAMIFEDDRLRGEILCLQAEAKRGLTELSEGVITHEELARDLAIRKTAIVAASPSHNFTVEKLVSSAIEKVVAKAAEIKKG